MKLYIVAAADSGRVVFVTEGEKLARRFLEADPPNIDGYGLIAAEAGHYTVMAVEAERLEG